MTLAEKLKEQRVKHGYTQEEIAKKIGISQAAYNYFESGFKVPSLATVTALSDIYEMTIDELVK